MAPKELRFEKGSLAFSISGRDVFIAIQDGALTPAPQTRTVEIPGIVNIPYGDRSLLSGKFSPEAELNLIGERTNALLTCLVDDSPRVIKLRLFGRIGADLLTQELNDSGAK